MERVNPESVGDILRGLLKDTPTEDLLDERKAIGLWQMIVGDEIALKCRRPYVSKGMMSIGVANASLRHELSMNRTRLKDSINRMLGKNIIKDIRFTS